MGDACIVSMNPNERGLKMNSVTLLIIWSAFLNSPHHYNDGSLQIAYFQNSAACEFALNAIKARARNVNGICVPEGSRPDPSQPGKSGPSRQVWSDLR